LRAKNAYLDIREQIDQPRFVNILSFESATQVLNDLTSKVHNRDEWTVKFFSPSPVLIR